MKVEPKGMITVRLPFNPPILRSGGTGYFVVSNEDRNSVSVEGTLLEPGRKLLFIWDDEGWVVREPKTIS